MVILLTVMAHYSSQCSLLWGWE